MIPQPAYDSQLMPTYSVSTRVDASPGAVFAYVADLTRHGEWSADPLEIKAVTGDGGEGSEYESTAKSKGKTIAARLRVVESRSPSAFGFVVTDLTGEYDHRFSIKPDGKGTIVERRIATSNLSVPQRLLFYVVYPTVKRPNARRAMERLKEKLEAD